MYKYQHALKAAGSLRLGAPLPSADKHYHSLKAALLATHCYSLQHLQSTVSNKLAISPLNWCVLMNLNCILPRIRDNIINFFSSWISFPALGLLDWANKSSVFVAVFLLGVSWPASVCQPRQKPNLAADAAGTSAGAGHGGAEDTLWMVAYLVRHRLSPHRAHPSQISSVQRGTLCSIRCFTAKE